MNKKEKCYKLDIDPRILELLGPNLYTNIYYILAELIANAYDADAHNVYIIDAIDHITVEDDGRGMSYENGEVNKFLRVAAVSRTSEDDSKTKELGRLKMGRKGIGKLAALSVSDNVYIKTCSNGEKSGFILSKNISENGVLSPIDEDNIHFEKIENNGTAIVMEKPKYKLHATMKAVKRNLLKLFPLVNKDFAIHIIRGKDEEIINSFDEEIIQELCTLITLGDDFSSVSNNFKTDFPDKKDQLLEKRTSYKETLQMLNNHGLIVPVTFEVKGWIGTYTSTRGRKTDLTDFPDNFISIYANKKMGEFNVLPLVGQNKLNEVYVVGQLHIDVFEQSDLPDMALSNRQGYKADDPRYQKMLEYVRNILLTDVLKKREIYVDLKNLAKEQERIHKQAMDEDSLKKSVETFRKKTTSDILRRLNLQQETTSTNAENIINEVINENSPELGIKSKVDSQKKKLLISQTYKDKDLADIIYKMLIFNGAKAEDIIYSNCDDEISRIPEGDTGKSGIYNYLKRFFVDSYSTQKIYVLFVTSNDSKLSWGALTEVGAAWITGIEHKIFNIYDFRPEHPLDDEAQWHISKRNENGEITMSKLSADIFCQKIEFVCDKLGYKKRDRQTNKRYLETLAIITNM